MAYNKVVYGGETLIDLTEDNVTPETLAAGKTATAANGEKIVGLMPTITEEYLQNVVNTAQNASDKVDDLEERMDSGEFKGEDGYTPVKGVDYFDGSNGKDGSDGVSCTHSWNGTTLTVTSASGSSSANLKGDKGDKGDTGEVDYSRLNDYLPLAGGTMKGAIEFPKGSGISCGGGLILNLSTSGNLLIGGGGSVGGQTYFYTNLRPGSAHVDKIDLGMSGARWRNIYLSGVLSDDTNSVAIADIAKKSDIDSAIEAAIGAAIGGSY